MYLPANTSGYLALLKKYEPLRIANVSDLTLMKMKNHWQSTVPIMTGMVTANKKVSQLTITGRYSSSASGVRQMAAKSRTGLIERKVAAFSWSDCAAWSFITSQ